MATKSYSKHREYKEFSSSGKAPYTDEAFDMMKSELIPKGSKLETFGRAGSGSKGASSREYQYEYKEEKHPTGKYDRKDLHTVEEYTIPAKKTPKSESSSYYYEREERELPAIQSSGVRTYNYETNSSTPGYSKVKSSKVSKDMSHNVDELDSLLDDLQKDQERQLYKSGYTSDTAESTSFDYKKSTPIKAPSSGYSTLKREERMESSSSSWGASPPPPPPPATTRELRQEIYREENTESRLVPVAAAPAPRPVPAPRPAPAPAPSCSHCHHTSANYNSNTGTLTRSSTPMNKVTTTVKTYTYEVPADTDPASLPLPSHHDTLHSYTTDSLNTSGCVGGGRSPTPGGCQYCSHCNSRQDSAYTRTLHSDEHTSNSRMVFPSPANETKLIPIEPANGHIPYAPASYKYSETTYSAQNSTSRSPLPPGGPLHPVPPASPRVPRSSPGTQQPPKKLDDLLADFPEARFPTQPDGIVRRKVEMSHEAQREGRSPPGPAVPPAVPLASRNVSGPAVYYPPGHTPFVKKDESGYQSSAMQAGGGYAAGRGMYEYESGAKSKEKHSEKKTAVPICLPLCCAMPCVIM